jgi:hypothetical protein
MRLIENDTNQSINFQGFECRIEMGQYSNGRTAMELVEIGTEEPVLVATVNIPFEALMKDEVIIKNYSENEGILEVLIAANVISEPIRYASTGWTSSPVCKLLK